MQIERIKGFRDFYPEDMEIEKFIFETASSVAESYGFKRIDFPSLEYIDLYRIKSGEELLNQTYSFTDRGGREVTLIPEATPSTVRMLTSRKDIAKPVRWYSFPKVWRYEEPQAGRFREHYQFNADIFGPSNEEADAEIISLASGILDGLGLSGAYEIRVNSRIMMEDILNGMGIADPYTVFSIVDRFHKVSKETFVDDLMSVGLSEENSNTIYRMCSEASEPGGISGLFGSGKVSKAAERLIRTIDILKEYGVKSVKYDFSIVRGLSYYTGLVFEAYDKSGQFRAILGGGRYDNLAKLFSEQDIPAVGFGMGDAVISLLLKSKGVKAPHAKKSVYVCRVGTVKAERIASISKMLRSSGFIVSAEIMDRSLSSQLKYASYEGCEYAVIAGERDLENNSVTVRDLSTGEQEIVTLGDLVPFLEKSTSY
ncbi:tRNA synthetase His [Thermoplasma volcanium GSS1]|uniref:Histidine--tRNA ligase n=1 Tax=Thermoplasma volcanium (strain ATCC 51530 / DSM 4299 / JCM 9571 / NBRC 15438 / GSS1) TaxID=273116 RepID=SYH_THEVO|nr:histidine--tRNA ligase [Thermoplasma volcanium]Q97CE6.1 RecName: Full=Histidine--tRNA ligase; AltName: Full=Histidyl-tRNA synthetase; Short=HisRS [Thermoplasma volcanium GSS1]BAB59297.1 tRNA synthetase His [Thermoplasma volcanium GSS1]